MILARRVLNTSHWRNYGGFTLNLDALSGSSNAQQEEYLAMVREVFPNTDGAVPWVRDGRTGIEVTAAYPNWNTDATRYWPLTYFRTELADAMSRRFVMLEPSLWVRPSAVVPIRCTPNTGPAYFGRNDAGTEVVADGDNTWRRDIRLNLDRLMTNDVGSTGGEPYVTMAKYTNYRNLLVLGPHEIDVWQNARAYYLADGEAA